MRITTIIKTTIYFLSIIIMKIEITAFIIVRLIWSEYMNREELYLQSRFNMFKILESNLNTIF